MATQQTKRKPVNLKALLWGLEGGNLDGRSFQARLIQGTADALEQDAQNGVKSLLRHNLGICAAIEAQILKELQDAPFMDADGRVNKVVTQDLLNVQRTLALQAQLLLSLEKAKPAKPDRGTGEAAAVILEIDEVK